MLEPHQERTIDTTILADDGQTIVLGGLIQDDLNVVDRHIPLLGDIPWLGQLFSNDDNRRTKRNLLVFLRPTVLRDAREIERLTADKHQNMADRSEDDAPPPSTRELFDGRQDLPDRPIKPAE